ncbi:hypothetical protein [Xylocopilactobacillus apicola]|uniref:Uncharacterized protein n=1 Tax=Xylocopilactobacillus apicola TaxID=2932184 RepID=A0AAU9DA23_9LACO|nr:hypothetical protein [Xylocopilactobacillus apicola]BDR59225.1 hypothetical protein XA3_16660 [Xylocopilactobacillus apicola]
MIKCSENFLSFYFASEVPIYAQIHNSIVADIAAQAVVNEQDGGLVHFNFEDPSICLTTNWD